MNNFIQSQKKNWTEKLKQIFVYVKNNMKINKNLIEIWYILNII